jgi:hypothetical protein
MSCAFNSSIPHTTASTSCSEPAVTIFDFVVFLTATLGAKVYARSLHLATEVILFHFFTKRRITEISGP